MADVQGLFESFHAGIRTYYEINDKLREKKDIVVDRVKAHLRNNDRPSCREFIQGSYKMKVGILPIEGAEYDIDVGLRFAFDDEAYSADEVYSWIFEAVDGHTERVEQKGPCVRVIYSDGFHVDLVGYCRWGEAGSEQYRLAHRDQGWMPADPPRLVEFVKAARDPFAGTEDSKTSTDQLRRVVRYLKRWNDVRIPGESDEKPSGLALVLLAIQHLTTPQFEWDGSLDDRSAVEIIAVAAGGTVGRITADKPTPEYEEMFSRISDDGMRSLKADFQTLAGVLSEAREAKDGKTACEILREEFGPDFPCPDDGDGGGSRRSLRKTAGPAVVPSSTSA